MPTDTTCRADVASATGAHPDPTAHHGWQALAAASLGRLLSDSELATAQAVPADTALDLLFPHLTDAARHEALWALG